MKRIQDKPLTVTIGASPDIDRLLGPDPGTGVRPTCARRCRHSTCDRQRVIDKAHNGELQGRAYYLVEDTWSSPEANTIDAAFRAAEKRHRKELVSRFEGSVEWADYAVTDLKLTFTTRQANMLAIGLLLAACIGLVGFIAGLPVVLVPSGLAAVVLAFYGARDVCRRFGDWMVAEDE